MLTKSFNKLCPINIVSGHSLWARQARGAVLGQCPPSDESRRAFGDHDVGRWVGRSVRAFPGPRGRPGPRFGGAVGVVVPGAPPVSVCAEAPTVDAKLASLVAGVSDVPIWARLWFWLQFWGCGHPGPLRDLVASILRLDPGAMCSAIMPS